MSGGKSPTDSKMDVRDNPVENTASADESERLDRLRLCRERREAEQRRRLDELHAHAAAAEAQREKREEERRQKQAEQRAKDEEKRKQVEERKRAINNASISRTESMLKRDRERAERIERTRAERPVPRSSFAFGSSTPRLLEPLDAPGYIWAARSTNPVDQINFFDSPSASTSNVMFSSTQLNRPASTFQLNADADIKDESEKSPLSMWPSVARRRTDLVPTLPAPRAPGRAHSMTRLDKLPSPRPLHMTSPSMHHLNRPQTRSGETTPSSRPGSALSKVTSWFVKKTSSMAPKKPRPSSMAGTGINSPKGEGDILSGATTPSVPRDVTQARAAPRLLHPMYVPASSKSETRCGKAAPWSRPGSTLSKSSDGIVKRTASLNVPRKPIHFPITGTDIDSAKDPTLQPMDCKPPVYNSKEMIQSDVGRSLSIKRLPSSGQDRRSASPTPVRRLPSTPIIRSPSPTPIRRSPSPTPIRRSPSPTPIRRSPSPSPAALEVPDNNDKKETCTEEKVVKAKPDSQTFAVKDVPELDEFQESDGSEESDQSALMSTSTRSAVARRIKTAEEAKAALTETRRRAREEKEKQAELERQRLQIELDNQAERKRLEEERRQRDESWFAALEKQVAEEKVLKAIELQKKLACEEMERMARESTERKQRLKEEENKRKAAEEAEKLRKEEAEREEKERIARKQRVEAILARTRFKKADGQSEQELASASVPASEAATPQNQASSSADNGNALLHASPADGQSEQELAPASVPASEAAALQNQASSSADNGNAVERNLSDTTLPTNLKDTSVLEPHWNLAQTTVLCSTRNNGNLTADLIELPNNAEDSNPQIENSANANTLERNNGNVQRVLEPNVTVGHITADLIPTENSIVEVVEHSQTKLPLNENVTAHNGHGATNSRPLTLEMQFKLLYK